MFSAWRHLIDFLIVITLKVTTSKNGSICICVWEKLRAKQRRHLWAYSLYSDIFEQETLTLKWCYLCLTMCDHNPINEGRN